MSMANVVNKKGKIGVTVDLYRIDTKEFHISDWDINNGTRLIQYDSYRFYHLYECMYWYAIEINSEYYAFNISDIISMIGFKDLIQRDKDAWLLKFIERLESSQYYLDFEKSIRQYLNPMSRYTNMSGKHRLVDFFFPVVKLVKRFHLKLNYS